MQFLGQTHFGRSDTFVKPSRTSKRQFVSEVDALKRVQAVTAAELDALLPPFWTKLSKENYEPLQMRRS